MKLLWGVGPHSHPLTESSGDGITLVWIPWLGGTRQGACLRCLHQGSTKIWVEALAWGARPVQAPPPLPSRTWKHKAGVSSPTLLLAKHSLLLYVCLSHTQSKSSPIKWAEGSSISMNQLYWVPVSTGTTVYGHWPIDKTSHQHDIILGSTN